jgi:hypothetical protein
MPQVGFESTVQVLEQVKIFHALDSEATVIGKCQWLVVTNVYAKIQIIKSLFFMRNYLKELLYVTQFCVCNETQQNLLCFT